jgi:N-acyl-D-amino-acid deacylase
LADGADAIKERLSTPETRARVAKEMKEHLAELGQDDYSYAVVANYRPEPAYEGKSIREITTMRGAGTTLDNQIETILTMTLEGGAQMVYHSMGPEDVERIMRYANTAVASDGGVREFGVGMPHPRSYACNARVLAEYVRKRQVITLEDAIRRMTSLPARTFGFKDRGVIREGAAADILVFDPAKIEDKATFQQPHQYSAGFDYVFVNGTAVVDDGKLADVRPGKILRRTP